MAKLIFSAVTSLDGYIEDKAATMPWRLASLSPFPS
jgi:dihydrofolate reductase